MKRTPSGDAWGFLLAGFGSRAGDDEAVVVAVWSDGKFGAGFPAPSAEGLAGEGDGV